MNLFIKNLSLINFRNHREREFEFFKNIIFIIGDNAIGKSSLLEAIQLLSVNADGWIDTEKQLITIGEEYFKITNNYTLENRDYKLEYRGGSISAKNIKLNGVDYRSLNLANEFIPKTISFRARESLEIVKGSPSERRNWLDGSLKILNLKYADNLKKYLKALEQRNCLLKTFSEKKRSKQSILSELPLWDAEMAKYGFYLMQIRQIFLKEIKDLLNQNYQNIAKACHEKLEIQYLPCLENCSCTEDFEKSLQERYELDLIRGQTSIGAHRDDFVFLLNDNPARHFASQGQQRTCALALKLVQLKYWTNKLDYAPILLLDDVSAELDINRQNALFEFLPIESQVFITTTHLQYLPNISSENYQIVNLNKINL